MSKKAKVGRPPKLGMLETAAQKVTLAKAAKTVAANQIAEAREILNDLSDQLEEENATPEPAY